MKTSENIKDISQALVKFQAKVANPTNSRIVRTKQYSYGYATLENILNEVRPLLSEQGLSVTQAPVIEEGQVGVITTLIHSSGQFLEFPPIYIRLEKQTPQGVGSAITYARRYSLSAILGIASEEDDDGAAANPGITKAKFKNTRGGSGGKTPSEAQVGRLYAIAWKKNIRREEVDAKLKKQLNKKPEELTIAEYDTVCEYYENLGEPKAGKEKK